MKKKVFVVTMYRYGDIEKHSYVLGVWSRKAQAEKAGATEEVWRGDKYKSKITEWTVDGNEYDNLCPHGKQTKEKIAG